MKLLLIMLGCVLFGCGGPAFSGSVEELSAAGSAGVAGVASAGAGGEQMMTDAGAGSGSESGQPSGGNSGAAGSAQAGSSGAGDAGAPSCPPLACRNLTTGDVYCGLLTNSCGEQLDCGTACMNAGSCGIGNLCTVTCKPPVCADAAGSLLCGKHHNACGDEVDCGTIFECDGTTYQVNAPRLKQYPNGRCGTIPDGCGGEITCDAQCPAGTTCVNSACE